MTLIATDQLPDAVALLEAFEHPALLMNRRYEILAANSLYTEQFGALPESAATPHCYEVSHGYDRPCDQAGESCPLAAALVSRSRERVLHIHHTPRGPEHVDVSLQPIDRGGKVVAFVEVLKPIALGGGHHRRRAPVGRGEAFRRMLGLIARVAPSNAAVLLTGASGSGKEVAAELIHRQSPRARKPLVTLECAGLTESLFESEMFGHTRGSFTGAAFDRTGLVEAADGGTLFLDEIADVPLALQVKLLRLIETGTFRPVGSSEVRHSDFRLVCATHQDLAELVRTGRFRQDLYYRINVFPIRVPSLQERLDDLADIANSLLEELAAGAPLHLTESALQRLRSHHYAGNIRELRNILARASILTDTNIIDRRIIEQSLVDDASVASAARDAEPTGTEVRQGDGPTLEELERTYLSDLMARYHGDKKQVAAAAGISLRTLYRRLEAMGRA